MSKPKADATTQALLKRLGEMAQAEAERLDPRRQRDQIGDDLTRSVVGKLDALTYSASEGFWLLKANLGGPDAE